MQNSVGQVTVVNPCFVLSGSTSSLTLDPEEDSQELVKRATLEARQRERAVATPQASVRKGLKGSPGSGSGSKASVKRALFKTRGRLHRSGSGKRPSPSSKARKGVAHPSKATNSGGQVAGTDGKTPPKAEPKAVPKAKASTKKKVVSKQTKQPHGTPAPAAEPVPKDPPSEPREILQKKHSAASVVSELHRAKTSDALGDDELKKLAAEAEAKALDEAQEKKKVERSEAKKELHARRMRFYRTLASADLRSSSYCVKAFSSA